MIDIAVAVIIGGGLAGLIALSVVTGLRRARRRPKTAGPKSVAAEVPTFEDRRPVAAARTAQAEFRIVGRCGPAGTAQAAHGQRRPGRRAPDYMCRRITMGS